MSLSESALLALAGVALLVLLRWTRRIHLSRLEKAWLPPELHEAALIYREQVFRVRSPMLVVAKVDRGYRTGDGLVLDNNKTSVQYLLASCKFLDRPTRRR